MVCEKTQGGGRMQLAGRSADVVADLFAKGHVEAAGRHRLAICIHATKCGRPCRWFIKAPGILAYCAHPELGVRIELYVSLESAAFACPDHRFPSHDPARDTNHEGETP